MCVLESEFSAISNGAVCFLLGKHKRPFLTKNSKKDCYGLFICYENYQQN